MKRIAIIVEVINRELENALLLKCELERRGYKVKILNKTEQFAIRSNDLIIIPNCYNTQNYEFYRYRFNCKSGNIVSLQSEQILSKDPDELEFYIPKGRAKEVHQLCWGEEAFNRLSDGGISKNNLSVVGAIQLDTARAEFNDLWKTREIIAQEFELPQNRKWLLFISSFSYTEDNLVSQAVAQDFGEKHVTELKKISAASQKGTLQWFDELLEIRKDIAIIYRPHPTELQSVLVNNLKQKYDNRFFCINDYSIKQWIKVCDVITTWFSTSIAEATVMKKNCLIIRPIKIPELNECGIYIGAEMIEDKGTLFDRIDKYNEISDMVSINKDIFDYYYDILETPSYMRICDVIEKEIRKTDNKEEYFWIHRMKYLLKEYLIIKVGIKRVYMFLYKHFKFHIKNKNIRSKFFVEEWEKSVNNRINAKESVEMKIKMFRKVVLENE